MKENLYDLSDGLFELRRAFVSNEGGSVVMTADQVTCICELLMHFGQVALKQAHEISRHRWNEQARADNPIRLMVDAIMEPGSNVVALSQIMRARQPEVPA